jgi:hypothetical protein
MRYRFLITIMIFFTMGISYAQDNEIWTSFRDNKTDLIGYKDFNQAIKIKPKFIFSIAKQFLNIIAVMEQTDNNTHESYYLLKNGKRVGKDNIYICDNTPDCESEEKIRFRDNVTDKVGFFDKNGNIAIPADYNEALPFRNNMTVVLKNAERVCWNGEKYSEKNKCEHWSWKNGQTYLINHKNEILIENFDYKRNLDWFSLKILDTQEDVQKDELNRDSFKGTNNKYYSFVNFEKEFKNWFESIFLLSTNLNSLKENCFTEIAFWSNDKSDWIIEGKASFLEKNSKVVIQQINDFRLRNVEHSVHKDNLNPYIFNSNKYSEYFDSCGNSKEWEHPVFTGIVSHRDEKGILELDYKSYFEFLKTDNGYKLIGLGLKDKGLK